MPLQRSHAGTLVVAIALLTAACGSDSQQIPIAPSPPAPSPPPRQAFSISGVVTEQTASGVVVLAGVRVRDAALSRLAISNATGAYRLGGVFPGPFQLHIDHSGFEPVTREITVTGHMVLDVELVRRAPGSLSGRITEVTPDGPRPVAGVDIEAVICPTAIFGDAYRLAVAESDADGFYRIPGLCSGETAVFVYKPGYRSPSQDGLCTSDGADCVFVTIAGDTREDFELTRVR